MRDVVNKIGIVYPVDYADHYAATVAPVAIDLQGYNGVAIAVRVGTITGTGSFTPTLQDSDDGSTWTDVPTAEIVGDVPGVLVTDTNQKFGYNGIKRYVGVAVVKEGTVSVANFGITAVLGRGDLEPVDA